MPFIQKRLGGAYNLSFRTRFHINTRVPQRKPSASPQQQQHTQVVVAPRISIPNTQTQRRGFLYSQHLHKMASDEDYMAFLNKANQDAEQGQAAAASSGQQQRTFKATDQGSALPKSIADVLKDDVFYVSEADEPFRGVSLKWKGEGGLPDEVEFAKLINHWDAENAQVDIMDPVDWDADGKYSNIIDAVREATRGNDVRVYRVARDLTRMEYDAGGIICNLHLGFILIVNYTDISGVL
ncbi:hypothetical protein ACQKWADRAFT_291003 [Trichoderma austrokoningii]